MMLCPCEPGYCACGLQYESIDRAAPIVEEATSSLPDRKGYYLLGSVGGLNCGQPEPVVPVPTRRGASEADRRTAVPADGPPALAAEHPVRGRNGHLRMLSAWQLLDVPIATPLPHVAVHIVQAPVVSCVTSHGRGSRQVWPLCRAVVRIIAV